MLCYNEVALRAAEGEAPAMAPPRTPHPHPHGAYRVQDQCIRQEVAIGELVENCYMSVTICVLTGTETCSPKRELVTGAVSLVKVCGLGVHRI